MDNTKVFHQNYEEDFIFVLKFPNGEYPTYPWKLVFNTYNGTTRSRNSFVATFNGTAYVNCNPVDGTSDTVNVQFKDHHLPPGQLCFRLLRIVPNDLFDDGIQNKVLPQETEWVLWTDKTDGETPATITIVLERMLRGDSAYEAFKRYHPESEMTEQEYALAPVDAADAANVAADRLGKLESDLLLSERLRKQSEDARAVCEDVRERNEALRQEQESRRFGEEQTRGINEQLRVAQEDTRASAESVRAQSEFARVASETERVCGEQLRIASEQVREQKTSEAIRNTYTSASAAVAAAENADEQAVRAQALADHPPKIIGTGDVKYWAFWDEAVQDYVTSEYRAEGITLYPVFSIDPKTMRLSVTYPDGYGNWPEFSVVAGKLCVTY